jgi:hypothetical protein
VLTPLIVLSVLAGAGWLLLPGIWRGRRHPHHDRKHDGLLTSNGRGVLPALLGVTTFLLAGWMLFAAGPRRPGGQVPAVWRAAAAWIFLVGFVFIACYLSVFISGRPEFMVPASMRRRGRALATDSGRSAGGTEHRACDADCPDPKGADVVLQAGERLYARFLGNHVQGTRAFGGHVTVTSSRLVFMPVAASQANGGARWEVPLAEVTGADVARRGWSARNGSWRRRLRVRTIPGDVEYFVVWRPRKAAGLVELARGG